LPREKANLPCARCLQLQALCFTMRNQGAVAATMSKNASEVHAALDEGKLTLGYGLLC
jgi:hypothetical protein